MTRARTKEAQEAFGHEVNYFLSQVLGQDVSYSLSLMPIPEERPIMLQLIEVDEECNEET